MSVENVSLSDAIYLINNNIVNKVQSFSQVTADSVPPIFFSRLNSFYSQSKFNYQLNPSYFPPFLSEMKDSLVNGKNKNYRKKKKASFPRSSHLPGPTTVVSLPSGVFLTYVKSSKKSLSLLENPSSNLTSPI